MKLDEKIGYVFGMIIASMIFISFILGLVWIIKELVGLL